MLSLPKFHDFVILLIIVLASVYTLSTLIPQGMYYAHDIAYHLARTYHYGHEMAQGQFPVRMAREMMWHHGYPVFNYAYPLPYFFGSLLMLLGLPLTESVKVIIVAASIASVIAFYMFLRGHFSPWASLIGTCTYLFVPYRFLTLFVTGQIGTVFAFLFIPLVLLSLQRLLHTNSRRKVIFFAVSFAGLLLSHLISAVIALPIFISYVLAMMSRNRVMEQGQRLVIGSGLSFLFASFYMLPAVFERSYIAAGHRMIVDYAEHFVTLKQLIQPSWGYGFSAPGINDGMSFQLGVAQWLVIGLSGIVCSLSLFISRLRNHQTLLAVTFLGVICVSLFLMMEASSFLWRIIPGFDSLQHPWRFLLVPMVAIPYLSAYLITLLKSWWMKTALAMGLLILLTYGTRNYLRPMTPERFLDDHYTSNANLMFGSGDISEEFLPIWVTQIDKTLPVPGERRLPFYFPMWKVMVDDVPVSTYPTATGLLGYGQSSPQARITVTLESTPLQKVGNSLSIIGCLVSLVLWIRPDHFIKKSSIQA